jgi:hypothetical protein
MTYAGAVSDGLLSDFGPATGALFCSKAKAGSLTVPMRQEMSGTNY